MSTPATDLGRSSGESSTETSTGVSTQKNRTDLFGGRWLNRLSRFSRLSPYGLLTLWALLALFSCGKDTSHSTAGAPPNVLFILIDALRADHLGCYGYDRATSPTLDSVAANGVVFENAMSQASWTKPSIPSIFTGLYPIGHGVFTGSTRDEEGQLTSDILRDDFVTLAEVFQNEGYATGAFINNVQIRAALGFGQGFDVYKEELGLADRITDEALQWLRSQDEQPFFAYVHYLDPHWPYTPPDSLWNAFPIQERGTFDFNSSNWKSLEKSIKEKRFEPSRADLDGMLSLYDAEILFADSQIGRLLAELDEDGQLDNTIIVITADHGEAFMDHGGIGHGTGLHRELLHVPLIIRAPGVRPLRVADPVELIDLMPTLAEISGRTMPVGVAGVSLADLMHGKEVKPRATFADHRPSGSQGRIQQSVQHENYKLIRLYKSRRRAETRERVQMPVLNPGTWLRIKFAPLGDGELFAFEVQPTEEQKEVSLSGQLGEYSAEDGTFRLTGIAGQLQVDARVRDGKKASIPRNDIRVGDWVKVRGSSWQEGRFEVFRMDRIDDPARQKTRLKARLSEVGPGDPVPESLELSGFRFVIDEDTDFEQFTEFVDLGNSASGSGDGTETSLKAPAASETADSPGSTTGDATPSSAEAGSGERQLEHVVLFDLASDPDEQNDVSSQHPKLVTRLMRKLDRWEALHAGKGQAAVVVDAESAERLRSLGYIQ